jgi:acylphosphatase
MDRSMIRITVTYTGHVQGVGFRYTTYRIAQRFGVAGYVMNLPDGRVELVVEGGREEAHAFVAAVKESLGQYISDTKPDMGSASGEFGEPSDPGSFTVRH